MGARLLDAPGYATDTMWKSDEVDSLKYKVRATYQLKHDFSYTLPSGKLGIQQSSIKLAQT